MQSPRSINTPDALAWAENTCITGVDKTEVSFWIPAETCAVLGLSQKPEIELCTENLAADAVPIYRRHSGGGAVILSPQTLCFEIFAPPGIFSSSLSIHESFEMLTEPVLNACSQITRSDLPMKIAGISDLAVEYDGMWKKFCGCAQMRKRGAVLVHGSILLNADKNLFSRYLSFPSEVPDYRAGRKHTDFCINLSEVAEKTISPKEIAEKISASCQKNGWSTFPIPEVMDADVRKLAGNKYRNAAWNIKRERPKI